MGDIEQRVLSSLERYLFAPEMAEAAVSAYREETERLRGSRDSTRDKLQRAIVDIDRKLSRLLRMVEDGNADPAAAGPRVNELSAEKRRLTAELVREPERAAQMLPMDGGASYRRLVSELRSQLDGGSAAAAEAVNLVRGIVRRVTVLPASGGNRQPLEIEAGTSPGSQSAGQYCEVGCGGSQPSSSPIPRLPPLARFSLLKTPRSTASIQTSGDRGVRWSIRAMVRRGWRAQSPGKMNKLRDGPQTWGGAGVCARLRVGRNAGLPP